jgi:molybdopterin-guanine dinucleotide biosynthesis protein MobB
MQGECGAGRPAVIGVVGWKNSGKTTLVERLVAHFVAAELVVSTVKHTHHSADLDRPGKDTYRHRAAGAREVVLASSARFAILHELRDAPEPKLDALIARMAPADLVIVEGFKRFPHRKIEVHRGERAALLLAREDRSIIAVASDQPLHDLAVPVLPLDDIRAIARFIAQRLELPRQ